MGMSGDYEGRRPLRPRRWCASARRSSARATTRFGWEVFSMGLIDDLKKWAHPYEDEDERIRRTILPSSAPATQVPLPTKRPTAASATATRTAATRSSTSTRRRSSRSCSSSPSAFENASEIADHLKEKAHGGHQSRIHEQGHCPPPDRLPLRRRLRGRGQDQKVTANTYIITPYHVDIMGDLIDELENNGLASL